MSAAAAVLVVDRAPQGGEHIKTAAGGQHPHRDAAARWRSSPLLYGADRRAPHLAVRRPLLEISLDPDAARAHGRRLRGGISLFYVTFGVVVTSSVRLAGVLLVFSYLIVPAAVAALARPARCRRAC